MPESPDPEPRSAEASEDVPSPLDPARPDAVPPPVSSRDDPAEAQHVHQYVAVRIEETSEALLVTRTETLLAHRHAPEPAEIDRRARPTRPRRLPGRPGAGPAVGPDPHPRGSFITFGSKSRLPPQLPRAQLIAYLDQERRIALDVRDPLAISFAAERYNTLSTFLEESWNGETVDLLKPVLSVSQAAKILGYNAKEVRRLLGQGKISGRKVGNEWRIPLRAVL